MYFVHRATGKKFSSVCSAAISTVCKASRCEKCKMPNIRRPDIFPDGIAPVECGTFMSSYPLIAAEYCGCDVVFEPGDEGFEEQTDILSVDTEALGALLGG